MQREPLAGPYPPLVLSGGEAGGNGCGTHLSERVQRPVVGRTREPMHAERNLMDDAFLNVDRQLLEAEPQMRVGVTVAQLQQLNLAASHADMNEAMMLLPEGLAVLKAGHQCEGPRRPVPTYIPGRCPASVRAFQCGQLPRAGLRTYGSGQAMGDAAAAITTEHQPEAAGRLLSDKASAAHAVRLRGLSDIERAERMVKRLGFEQAGVDDGLPHRLASVGRAADDLN